MAYSDSDPGSIVVVDVDDDTTLDKVDVVIGVGTRARLGNVGYKPLDRLALSQSMLKDERDMDGAAIIEHALPRIFSSAKYAPIFYPLSLAGRIKGSTITPLDDLPKHAFNLATGTTSLDPYFGKIPAGTHFKDLLAAGDDQALQFGTAATFDDDDIEALRQFLLRYLPGEQKFVSYAYKLVCMYDKLVYGPKAGL